MIRNANDLPTFEDMRQRAYALLGYVQDELRSDWRPGAGPNGEQAKVLGDARRAIAEAKEPLNRAARADVRALTCHSDLAAKTPAM